MSNLTAPTSNDIILKNWAGGPLAEWAANRQGRNVNFWASEDREWVYFQAYCPLNGERYTCDVNSTNRVNVSYDEAGKYLAKM